MVSRMAQRSGTARRVVPSVQIAQTFGLADTCDSAIAIHHYWMQILEVEIKIQVLTDGGTLLNVIIKQASTTEKRLMV